MPERSPKPADAATTPAPFTITLEANAAVPKHALAKVEKLKNEGNVAFRRDMFFEARKKYSQVCSRLHPTAGGRPYKLL